MPDLRRLMPTPAGRAKVDRLRRNDYTVLARPIALIEHDGIRVHIATESSRRRFPFGNPPHWIARVFVSSFVSTSFKISSVVACFLQLSRV